MEFEDWIRGQLQRGDPVPPGAPRYRPAPRPWPRFATVAVQALAGVAAITIIVVGLSTTESRPSIQLRMLLPAGPSLPADTWAGRPPLPAAEVAAVAPATEGIASPTSAPTAAAAPTQLPSAPPASPRQPAQGPQVAFSPSPEAEHEGSHSPAPAASSPPPPSARATSSFTLKGGTVTASCNSGRIAIDSITANSGFQSEVDARDGGRTIDVRLRSSSFESELQVWCSAGLVQSQVREGGD